MEVEVTYVTDPASPAGWAAEPLVGRVATEFGAEVRFTYRMSVLARTVDDPVRLAGELLDAGAASGMPVDARVEAAGLRAAVIARGRGALRPRPATRDRGALAPGARVPRAARAARSGELWHAG